MFFTPHVHSQSTSEFAKPPPITTTYVTTTEVTTQSTAAAAIVAAAAAAATATTTIAATETTVQTAAAATAAEVPATAEATVPLSNHGLDATNNHGTNLPPSAAASPPAVAAISDCGHTVIRSAAALSDLLPLPAAQGLTRSQQLFAIGTGIHPFSLQIARGQEFYLFMHLRKEQQWRTFGMTPRKYVEATNLYNVELRQVARKHGLNGVLKNPRALFDKLGEIEGAILKRIQKQDFRCTLLQYFVLICSI